MADVNKRSTGIPSCAVCGITGHLKRCSRCRNTFYCTREHQLKDWNVHKHSCSKQMIGENGNQERSVSDNKGQKITNPLSNLENIPLDQSNGNESDFSKNVGIDKVPKKTTIVEPTRESSKISAVTKLPVEQPLTKYNEQGEIEFDARPLKLIEFSKPTSYSTSDIADYVAKNLKEDGYCIVDGILDDVQCGNVTKEVKLMDITGLLKEGKLAGGKTSGVDSEKVVNKNIRSDKVAWLQGTETEKYPAVCQLITETMDDIVYGMRKHFGEKFLLNGRTKVCKLAST